MFFAIKVFLQSFSAKIIFWKITCKIFSIKIPKKIIWQQFLVNKSGLEIGGPSGIFNSKGYLPIYPIIRALDGVNFSTSTIWEGKLTEGSNFLYQNKTGYQYIAEGSNLSKIVNEKYDFVLSCNNLEHIANPITAIVEWKRIIKKGGAILLVLPNKLANFDNKRPFTKIAHLIDDFNKKTTEDDLTHLDEILQLHDLKKDSQAGDKEKFKKRCINNAENRCMHHHVFNTELLQQIFEFCEMKVNLTFTSLTDHYILAQKD